MIVPNKATMIVPNKAVMIVPNKATMIVPNWLISRLNLKGYRELAISVLSSWELERLFDFVLILHWNFHLSHFHPCWATSSICITRSLIKL